MKQIDKLEKQNPHLARNVFGWEKDTVIVHRQSGKDGSLPRINLMLIQDKEKTHYTYVKRLNALLYDQSKHGGVKYFCESCLHSYTTAAFLKGHKPECMGQLKRPTRTELPKEGENKVRYKNHHKQMKAAFVVYADFESLIKKIHGCAKEDQATIKTEIPDAFGFSYIIVRSDGETHGPFVYRGENAEEVLLTWLQTDEKIMSSELAPKPIVMTKEDWAKFTAATECRICNESLVKVDFRDAFDVYDPNTGKYCGQSHRRCYFKAMRGFEGPMMKRKPKPEGPDSKTYGYCHEALEVNNYRDAVKDHCHITGKYRGAAHNACNLKLRIKPQTMSIPVIFHNLKGYDSHLLMQAMSRVTGQINCIPNNMEKYISFSLGNLRFMDSFGIMMSSLDSLVAGNAPEDMKITSRLYEDEEKRSLMMKKGIYPYEYVNDFEKFEETELPPKKASYSKLSGKGITDKEFEHAQRVWKTFGCHNL